MMNHYTRKLLLTAGLLGSVVALPAWAAKDVTIAVASNFTTLDPYDANDTLSQAVAKSFYQGLFGFDKEMKLENVLAESYQASPDGLSYTIKLKTGVNFQDGTPFNAEAVKANLDRASNPDNHLKRYNLFKTIASTEVVDANTVKITLKQPFSAFINTLASPAAAMISPDALKKYGKDIGFHPVGTGPYEFVTWNQTDFVKVKKFAGYWKAGYPKLDSITWRPVVDNNTRSAMLQTGEANFAFPIPFEQAKLLEKNSKLDLVTSPSIMQRYISFNVTQKPFDNPKVREAINYAINREALAKVAFAGYATPATGIVPPSIQYSQSYPAPEYNPAKARELLKEAGYPNGFTTALWSSHNHSTAQKVLQFTQQQLAQVGIKVELTAMDAGQRAAQVEDKGQKESGVRMFYTGWSASTGEANWALTPLFATQSWPPTIFNTAFYSNTQVDKDLADALNTTDGEKKAALYKDAQDRIWKDQPWAPLVVEKLVSANTKNLTGFYVMPDTSFSFDDADLK
ncbi:MULTISPECIES: glutathione ABC transporter substrate-binding protein GsiB [Erwinia]|uniref:Glutathione-binding protein GsiB n=1 Tax=Erwinia rhapontici TaxID=55212 RepID=A0ABM7MY23_ERWRD|nr:MULTISPECIES: glutathione ABC transporter substrate-binding protein GsiB [Erwinia]MBP2154864.1 glutathione transport system substrate-binding protein [Erwinia rhapontici]MCS3605130.1 glutathione transport system substrate-binding protein [Erwinia rhapontici]TDT01484.1 glutathione transport system substrate-binding protein [Erwinia rhapontici]BCQ34063.1 glutathione ABC transporter substrate-binding protein GsiB [Erwinia rhapontici]BCQ38885.1 glutathione ABC transporter substrate-binding prot